jgi:hypothetical protein
LVSSTKSPTVTPRANRSAVLRASKDATPPSSYQCTSSPLLTVPHWDFLLFLFVWALTRCCTVLYSPVTDRSVPVAVHFKFECSSSIRARRREFSASVAFSDVRCWRKPPRELAGANHAASTEPQCDAASCQDGQRSIKGWPPCADATPLLTMCARACISNIIRSTHFYPTHPHLALALFLS